MVRVNDRLEIPDEELEFEVSHGGGPGGQHVNKVATRVTAVFDVANSPSLGDAQRTLILEGLASRITQTGLLRVSSQEHKSQAMNRERAVERLAELIAEALVVQKPRKESKPTRASRKRRVKDKRQRGQVKSQRSKRWSKDD